MHYFGEESINGHWMTTAKTAAVVNPFFDSSSKKNLAASRAISGSENRISSGKV